MSKLPKLQHPKFETIIPSSGKRVSFRPFTGKEQKVLLVAKESNDTKDMLRALAQVISSCFEIDAVSLPMVDIEYLFLALRAKSVNNKITVSVKDDVDGKKYDADISLDDVKFIPGTGISAFEVAPGVGIKMRYPTVASILASPKGNEMDEWDILAASVDSIWNGEEVIASSDITRPELKDWLSSLPLTAMEPIRDFIAGRPSISIDASYKREDGTEVTKKITGVSDFFD